MLKTGPLCTGAESNLRDRVLGEVEKNIFSALPGKGGCSGFVPQKLCPLSQRRFGEEFYSNGSRVGLLIKIRVSFNLSSGGLLMSFSMLSNCDLLWNEEC